MLITLRNSVADVLVKLANIIRYDPKKNLFKTYLKQYNPENDKNLEILFLNLNNALSLNPDESEGYRKFLFSLTHNIYNSMSTKHLFSMEPMTYPMSDFSVMEYHQNSIRINKHTHAINTKVLNTKQILTIAKPNVSYTKEDETQAFNDISNNITKDFDNLIMHDAYKYAHQIDPINRKTLLVSIEDTFKEMTCFEEKSIIVNKKTLKKLASLPEYKVINDIVKVSVDSHKTVLVKAGSINDIIIYLNTQSPENDILFVSTKNATVHKPLVFSPYVLVNTYGMVINEENNLPETRYHSRYAIGNRNINNNKYLIKAEVK